MSLNTGSIRGAIISLFCVELMTSLISNGTETEIVALKAWWERNCKPFSEWFLKLEEPAKLAVLRKGCPDMPAVSSATRAKQGAELKATDMLLPELSEDALLARGGQITVLFITRRLMDKGLCFPSGPWRASLRG